RERLIGDGLDHEAEHVEAEAVIPDRPGLMHQRYSTQAVEELAARHRRRGGAARSRIQLVNRGGAAAAIDDPRCVPHEILDSNSIDGRCAVEDLRAARV